MMVRDWRLLPVLAVVSLVGAGCNPPEEDEDSTPSNQAPQVEITGPEDGATVVVGSSVTFAGTVEDDRDSPKSLTVTWTSSVDGELFRGADTQGSTSFETAELAEGEHTITLKAVDSGQLEGTDTLTLTVTAAPNQAPVASISSPKEGATFPSGAILDLVGKVSDAEDAPESLTVQFESSLGGMLGDPAHPSASGQYSVKQVLPDGAQTLTLHVWDSQEEEGVSSAVHVTITPNDPPVVVLQPLDETLYDEGETLRLEAQLEDDNTAPEALELVWESSVDGPLTCMANPESDGSALCEVDDLSPGEHVLSLSATDEGGESSTDSLEVSINGAPGKPEVGIEPASPRTDDDLKAVILTEAPDPNDDPVTYVYAWYRNGSLVNGLSSATVPASSTRRGETWKVVATATDGRLNGGAANAQVTVVNTAPTLESARISPDSGYASDSFTCVPGAWFDADGDTERYRYAWYANGAVISGAQNAVYVPKSLKYGSSLACEITPDDGFELGTPVRSNDAVIDDRAPSVASASIQPSSGTETTTFKCVAAGWSDPDEADAASPGYHYRWLVNGVEKALTETLTGDAFNKKDTLECEVTPDDGALEGEPVRSASVVVGNSSPTVDGLQIVPDPAYVDSVLRCETVNFKDADGDAEVASFLWTINGQAVTAASSLGLSGEFVRGDKIGCSASVSDGEATAKNLVAPTVTVQNSPPSLTGVQLSPPAGSDKTTFTAVPTGWTDADGDSESYLYQWYVNGLASVTTAAITPSSFKLGDKLHCEVTPFDGLTTGALRVSATVEVGSTSNPPSVDKVSVTPELAYENSTLVCAATGATDPEGDTITLLYAWTKGGTTISGATSSQLTGASFAKHDVIQCQVTPKDPKLTGAPVLSNKVNIQNSKPQVASVSLTPAQPTRADTLQCGVSGQTDLDSDPVTLSYAWTINGVILSGASTSSLSSASFKSGDVVKCAATPFDGEEYGTQVSSSSVTILGSPPKVESVSLTPTTAYESSVLTCQANNVTDLDGDTVSLAYAWYSQKGLISGQSTSSLTGASFAKGDSIYCQVTPSAASQTGTTMKSNTVTILNSLPVVGSVALGPEPAYETTQLKCTASGVTDADGETPGLAYAWTVNGKALGVVSATLDGSSFSRADQVRCSVTPSDAGGSGVAVLSNTVTIANSAPVLTSVTLVPEPAYEDSVMQCKPGTATDADGNQVSSLYKWLVNGTAVSGESTSFLSGAAFKKGDKVACEVTPADDASLGTAVQSNTVTISNSAPVLASVSLSPTTAYETSTLTCTPGTATDKDGDTVTSSFAWTVNGTPVGGATSKTLTGSSFSRGDSVICLVTPTDGTTPGQAVASNTVVITNSLPMVQGAKLSPTTAYETSTLLCEGVGLSDADPGDTLSLTYAWTVNSTAVSGASSATLTGAAFNKGDVVACTVTPYDGTAYGSSAGSNPVTIINTAPSVTGVTLAPSSPTEASTLTCSYSGTSDVDGDTVSVAYAWKVNGTTLSSAKSATLTGTSFNKGDKVVCVVTPSDGTQSGTAVTSNEVTVVNTAPTLASISVTPSPAYEGSTLTCQPGSSSDPDPGDLVTFTYAWAVNGAAVSGQTTNKLTGTHFNKGDSVTCTGTPTDSFNAGTPVTSTALVISNTAPSLAGASLTPTEAYEATTLTCAGTGGSDVDPGDTVTSSFAWKVNGSVVSGQTSASLTGTHFNKGDKVVCVATPSDGTTAGSPLTSNEVTVLNTAPTLASISLSPTQATEASSLTCTPGTTGDVDGDTVTVKYAWAVNGTTVTGQTTNKLTGTYFNKGDAVTCSGTPNDGTVNGSSQTSTAVTIGNSAPSLVSVSVAPTQAYETSTLTCTPSGGSDPDPADSVTYTYAWKVNGSVVSGKTTSSLTGSSFDKGDKVVCVATPTDGVDSGTAVSSSAVTILNSAPSLASASLAPSPAYEASTLTCNPGTFSDADGDTAQYTYAWKVGGSVVSSATSATLDGSHFAKGDSVTCQVTPGDGTDTGTAVTSNSVTIANTAPSLASASISPSSPNKNSTLTCNPGTSTDVDGDSVTFGYAWSVGGVVVEGATSQTLSASSLTKGDVVRCIVTPTDGTTAGSPVTSSPVTLQNAPPRVVSATITPSQAYVESTLLCQVTTSDPDGDTVSVAYVWKVGTTVVEGASTSSLSAGFARGDSVTCEATPSDGSMTGTPVTSAAVTIRNTAPVAGTPTLEPEPPMETDTLTCVPGVGSDADGDSVTEAFAWFVNDIEVMGEVTDSLTGVDFDKGDEVYCQVTPNDGLEDGLPVASAATVVANTPPTLTTVSLSPTTVYVGTTITCLAEDYVDADGDPEGYHYAWYVNGSKLSSQTASTLKTGFAKGDVVQCQATPFDGTDEGAPVDSATITVLNSAPKGTSVVITPTSPAAGATLTAVPSATDPDGDSLTWAYSWALNGTVDPDLVSATIVGDMVLAGDVWTVTVVPSDGSASGPSASKSVTIGEGDPDGDGDGVTVGGGDCNDADAAVYPGAAEISDLKDNDCDGKVDEATDDDSDAYSEDDGDCNDADGAIYPGAGEPSNLKDDDCDGLVDEATDDDGDTWSEDGGDCNDASNVVFPDAAELLDGLDNDCNRTVDDRWVDLYAYGASSDTWTDIGPYTPLALTDDGKAHLFFTGKTGTSGGILTTAYSPSLPGFPAPTVLGTTLDLAYLDVSLYPQTSQTGARVAYYDPTAQQLGMFYTNDGSGWSTLAGITTSGSLSDGAAIVTVPATGIDYIFYNSNVNAKGGCAVGQTETKLVMVSRASGSGTLTNVLNPVTTGCTATWSLALSGLEQALGNETTSTVLHTAWYKATTGDMAYRKLVPGGTNGSRIDFASADDIGRYLAVAVTPGTNPSMPVIVYYNATANTLMLASTTNGTSFTSETIANETSVGYALTAGHVAAAFGSNGKLHVVFQAASGTRLMYGVKDSTTWKFETILSGANLTGLEYGLVVDADGNPRVSVQDASSKDVYLWKGKISTTTLLY